MKFTSVVIAVLAFCVQSFADEPDQSDYFQMNPGDENTLTVVVTTPNGQVEKSIAHRKIDGEVEKNGKHYFRLRSWIESNPTQEKRTRLLRKDDKGLFSLDDYNYNGKEQLEVPIPIKVGNTWKFEQKGIFHTSSIIGLETITIGEKAYANCIHIRTETIGGTFREDYWEAPKIGTVKSDIVYSNGLKMSQTLHEFKPGK